MNLERPMASTRVTTGLPSPGLLDRENIVARPGYNRWLVPPCALAIHLCIGMAYGFSVFWLPLSRAIGISDPVVCKNMTLIQALTSTSCDWRVSDLVWTYSIFFVVLGTAAALWGGWLERVGPRRAGVVAACCWCGGIALGALGVSLHQLWILWLGTGLLGGIGLGIGYITPVSTLIKWFPDRRGMATGMAIMGFGGGAMIGSPLADLLMRHFASASDVGVWQCFLVLALVYAVFMLVGAFGFRVPPEHWAPAGWEGPGEERAAISRHNVHLRDAHKTPQFWLIWGVLLLNVSASIGIIGVASPMLQEVFGGRLIDKPATLFTAFSPADKIAAAAVGAGFVGIISLFNIGGRFLWATSSDRLGRQLTFGVMTAFGALLYGFVAPALIGGSIGCSSLPSAFAPRCMAAASRPSRPISPISSEPGSSARSTVGSSPPGRRPACWARSSSPRSATAGSRPACRAIRSISPSIGRSPRFWWWRSSSTCSSGRSMRASICPRMRHRPPRARQPPRRHGRRSRRSAIRAGSPFWHGPRCAFRLPGAFTRPPPRPRCCSNEKSRTDHPTMMTGNRRPRQATVPAQLHAPAPVRQ